MKKLQIGSTTLLALAVAAACGDDPMRNAASEADLAQTTQVTSLRSDGSSENRKIAMLDDCDPRDLAWNATNGCDLRKGDVTNAEFGSFLVSPHSAAVIGHPAWRNQPSYLKVEQRKSVRVTNDGGRDHTFTRVANFGGGRVPPLNFGMTPAPECILAAGAVDRTFVQPGGRLEVNDLALGNHRFQCCFHPWMRALIKVQAQVDDDDGEHGNHR